MSAPAKGNGVVLTTRDPKASRFAGKSAYKTKTVRGHGRKVAGVIAKEGGRIDLNKLTLARASAILASQGARKDQRVRAARGNKA